jgi:tetratricopeptide (TPR) repeat protein
MGQTGQAAAALRRAISLDPQNPMPILELGVLLLSSGRAQEALSCFERARVLQPRSIDVHLPRGMALEMLGRRVEAASAYEEAVALAPSNAEAHARLGVLLRTQQSFAEAAARFRKAAKLATNTSLGRLCEAYALMAEGETEQAQAAFRRIVALEPKNATAHSALGKLLAESGKQDEARAAFERAIQLEPRMAGHYYDLVRIHPLGEGDRPLLQRMQDLSQRNDLFDVHRIMLELAIGKAYDDLGDPERAMQHYLRSGNMKWRLRPLDRSMIRETVDWAISTFTPDYFAAVADAGSSEDTPLMVVGMPRSGTTLVESILARHDKVAAGQELLFWGRVGRPMAASRGRPSHEALGQTAEQYLKVLRGISDAPYVTDKKPENFFWAGLVHAVFPQARIVHCRRDPLDTCVSIISNFFAPRPDFSTEPSDLVFFYREYERLMAHWRSVLPTDRFMELDYEVLVADPEPTIRRLIEFCGLEWTDACLHPEQGSRMVNTASLWQVRRPISKTSVGRWRRYEPWLGDLAALRR